MENTEVTEKKSNTTTIQAIKFTLFSLSAGIIQFLSFTLMFDLIKWPWMVSYVISITLSVLWNFTLNRKVTFKSASNIKIAMLKVLCYYLVFTPLSTIGGGELEAIGWNGTLVLIISMLINFITEFLYMKFFVFKK